MINRLLLFLMAFFIGLKVSANGNDTLQGKRDYYNFIHSPERVYPIDTTLHNLEQYNFVQTEGLEYYNLGNLGLAHTPLFYRSSREIGFQDGMDQFSLYRIERDSIRYYDLSVPYVELSYIIGLSNESLFQGRHSQRLSRTVDYGVDFHRISSNGQFASQSTLSNSFSFYTRYRSKNGRYDLLTNVVYNRMEADENGGVTSNIFDTTATFISSSIIEVNNESAMNDYRNLEFGVTNGWNFGFTTLEQVNDSVQKEKFIPQFRLEYDFAVGKRNNYFFDSNPDSAFYGEFYTEEDTLKHRLRYAELKQKITFSSLGNRRKGSGSGLLDNVTNVSLNLNNVELKQRGYEKTFNNLGVGVVSRSNYKLNSPFRYLFKGAYTLTGYNQDDFLLAAEVSYDFKKYGKLIAKAKQVHNEPSWIAQRYESFDLRWVNDFEKIRTFEINGTYLLAKQKLSLSLTYLRVDNQIYYDSSALPQQLSTGINGLVVSLRKDFKFNNFHWTNLLVFQSFNNDEDVLRIPAYWSKHSVYYEGRIFKGALLASLGFDLRYHSDFFANKYNPITGQFFLQEELELSYYPVMDLFLNAKVQSVRVSLKVNNVNQGLFEKGYYAAYLYPTDTRSFIVGIHWRFFD